MKLRIQLLSDSAFGRGDGIAGLVDSEVEHDPRTGFPYIKGRTVKGLLVESCADLLYALQKNNYFPALEASAQKLFGSPGSTHGDTGCLHVGSAQLPEDLRHHILHQHMMRRRYSPQQVLQAFTAVRHQTAVDPTSGKPKKGSLRATRVVLRETIFYAQLYSDENLLPTDEQLLAACAAGVKRGGQNRTRGLGQLHVELVDVPDETLAAFFGEIGGMA